MHGLKKHELFTVPQKERVQKLETTVIPWMNGLEAGEQLVIGLPQVLGAWDQCVPLVVGPGMQEQFLGWLHANAKDVEGPCYNLPALNAYFLCMVIDENFDPRIENPPEDASKELLGVLAALGNFMSQCEAIAA